MSWLSRGLIGVLVLAVLAFVGFNIFKEHIAMRAFERAVDERVGVDQSEGLPNGLHVYLCGTGSPMPDATRGGHVSAYWRAIELTYSMSDRAVYATLAAWGFPSPNSKAFI
ncbi:MAG: hypothetical protein AAFY84_16525 [Pseudomonadota bacterium]